jgi:hypothetical protein
MENFTLQAILPSKICLPDPNTQSCLAGPRGVEATRTAGLLVEVVAVLPWRLDSSPSLALLHRGEATKVRIDTSLLQSSNAFKNRAVTKAHSQGSHSQRKLGIQSGTNQTWTQINDYDIQKSALSVQELFLSLIYKTRIKRKPNPLSPI